MKSVTLLCMIHPPIVHADDTDPPGSKGSNGTQKIILSRAEDDGLFRSIKT
jgi:hypothetical protein